MDFIEKLKEKQKDQSAKNWFDLGVQTKSQDKKVKYFTKCLLIEPENAQALRLMADAQQEMGLIDAALGSRAKADEIERLAGGFEQDVDVTFENVNFGSDALNFEDEAIPANDMIEIIEEPQEGLKSVNPVIKDNKWTAFEDAKNKELEGESEVPVEYDAGVHTQDESEMAESIVIPEENGEGKFVEAAEEKSESTFVEATVEKPNMVKAEPVVAVKEPAQKVIRQADEKRVNASVTEPSVEKVTMVQTAPNDVAPAISQYKVTDAVPFTLPMREIIKFWVVGIVAILVAGFIMTALVGQ
ncbi:hypothetical protein [Methanococcoides alaskense]|uniref:Tetratricopeptide repeat protein n=1 Tax=Methanococcoides alaskense TaxID=325778 RepID=A0AA90ZDW4_9EURY|nr:hypothetical protein [Methanococcoides alaskense]MDA0524521.1 hypothetical protein [Methanococcoides alaskense]MDR6223973.1 hypothetical protein [Methanococcoides alaskense]